MTTHTPTHPTAYHEVVQLLLVGGVLVQQGYAVPVMVPLVGEQPVPGQLYAHQSVSQC